MTKLQALVLYKFFGFFSSNYIYTIFAFSFNLANPVVMWTEISSGLDKKNNKYKKTYNIIKQRNIVVV